MKVSVADAKNNLPQLLKAVEAGTRVTICRRGIPVAELVRSAEVSAKKPKFGTMRGRIVIHDANWWKPMTESEADDFLEGRY